MLYENAKKRGSNLLMMQCTTSTAGAFLQKLLQTESGRVDNKRLSHVLALRENFERYLRRSPAEVAALVILNLFMG